MQAVYRGKDRGEELTDMDEEAETKAIEKWLSSKLKLATNNTH